MRTVHPMAIFSEDRRYRYVLWRHLGFQGAGVVVFLMLNPSTADEHRDDSTIRRCMGYGRAWGYEWLQVLNLSPLRARDPAVMLAAGSEPAEVEKENLEHIRDAVGDADLVLAAWGNHGAAGGRAERVMTLLREMDRDIHCLAVTVEGQPYHPLYVSKRAKPKLYLSGKENR